MYVLYVSMHCAMERLINLSMCMYVGGSSSMGDVPPQMTYLDLFLRADQAGNTSDQLLWKVSLLYNVLIAFIYKA